MPFITAQNPCYARGVENSMLLALATNPGGALLTTPKVDLFVSGPSPMTRLRSALDYLPPTFTGYAQVSLVLGTTTLNLPSTNGIGLEGDALFTATADVPGGETVLGYIVSDGLGTLYWGEFFDSPQQIVFAGDFIDLEVVAPMADVTPIN